MSEHKKLKLSFNSPVILSFTIICFLAMLLNFMTGGFANRAFFSVYRSSLLSPLTYLRFFGHVLGHAGWEHFFGNITLILLSSFTCMKEGTIPITFLLVAVIYIGQQVYQGIFIQDNVSNLTHILGGIVGAALGYVMNRNRMTDYNKGL